MSDGDNFGMGQIGDSGAVGTAADIQTRTKAIAFNKYGENNQYGVTNPDAISPIGEGQNPNTMEVGKADDIQNRMKSLATNKWGTNKTYPDF